MLFGIIMSVLCIVALLWIPSCLIIVFYKTHFSKSYNQKDPLDREFGIALFVCLAVSISAIILCSVWPFGGTEEKAVSTPVSTVSDSLEDKYDEGYENGYDKGYEDGYSEGRSSGGSDLYEILNSEAFTFIKEEAEQYALRAYNWSPEEACEVIICYQNGEKFIDAIPTKDEYLEAVGTLIAFYDYFYSR